MEQAQQIVTDTITIADNRILIEKLEAALYVVSSVVVALAGVIYALWRHITKREAVGDGRTEAFIAVAKEMTHAVDGLKGVIANLDSTVERALIDPHLPAKRRRT